MCLRVKTLRPRCRNTIKESKKKKLQKRGNQSVTERTNALSDSYIIEIQLGMLKKFFIYNDN